MPRQWQLGCYLYATRADYDPVIRAVEAKRNLQYVPCGVFETPSPPAFFSGIDLPDLGIATQGDSIRENNYLVMDASAEVRADRFELYDGSIRYEISQLENPRSVTFRPGGLFDACCVIQGDVGTASRDPASVELYQCFMREFKKRFRLVHGHWWVGPEALKRFQEGMRLTLDARLRMHDLKPEPLALPPSTRE